MIKKLLLFAGILLASTALTVGILYFVRQGQTDSTPPAQSILDLSKDYGACSLLDLSFVKSTLASAASDLQEPENMGIVNDKPIGDDVEAVVADSQICTYAFIPGGTIENGFNASNGLTIQVTKYTNESGPLALIEQAEGITDNTEIIGLGDAAFYTSNTVSQEMGSTYSFRLQVFDGDQSFEYTIRQPAETATFTTESGQAALVKLATSAQN